MCCNKVRLCEGKTHVRILLSCVQISVNEETSEFDGNLLVCTEEKEDTCAGSWEKFFPQIIDLSDLTWE